MQEIEVKSWVEKPEPFLAALKTAGIVLGDPVTQDDVIYVTGDWEFTRFMNDRNIIRIRQQNGTTIFTLKRPGVNELDTAIEEEVTVSDAKTLDRMLKLLEYRPILEVHKTRAKAQHQGMEICLDQVEGIGTFIEVERLVEQGDAEAIQEELFQFLESLDITRENRVTRGYDTLVRLQQEGNLLQPIPRNND